MSSDIKAQLIDRLKERYLAIQLDESTDIAKESQLLVHVRYRWKGEMVEDFMLCNAMPSRTNGEEVFKVLDIFLTVRPFMKSVKFGYAGTVQHQ